MKTFILGLIAGVLLTVIVRSFVTDAPPEDDIVVEEVEEAEDQQSPDNPIVDALPSQKKTGNSRY